jgi:hypothetical protein
MKRPYPQMLRPYAMWASTTGIAQIASPPEFVTRAQEMQTKLAEIKQQPELSPAQARRIEAVEGAVMDAIAEARKPQPIGERINATLSDAKETMDKLAASVKSAAGLGAALAALGQVALKLFGG